MLSGIHNIHFIGIGGAGMSALAHVLCERGFHVSGSDKNAGGICEKLKALGAEGILVLPIEKMII